MDPDKAEALKQRVLRAAEQALAGHRYVSLIDILTGIGFLHQVNVERWRKGRLDVLESLIQGSPEKIATVIALFQEWAVAKSLKPVDTSYRRAARSGNTDLRFTEGGDPDLERTFRTHFLSPNLTERKQQKITEKATAAPPPVVFEIIRDSACSECGAAIDQGDFLFMEAGKPLCLPCARMDSLEFLASGDTALTRRSTKYSSRSAVVVRFSKSRGRYERQGILVEPSAIEKAERECSDDADARAKARAADAVRRQAEDRELVARMKKEIAGLFPGCPPRDVAEIAAHTAARGSGRVGRTAAGRSMDEGALTAAVAAAIRHRRTNYDELLASGIDREAARERVRDQVEETLADWRRVQ